MCKKRAIPPQLENENRLLGEYTTCMLAGATFMVLTRWADDGYASPT